MTEQDLGFRCPDLSAATAETADLGGLRFDDTQYADYEELTQKLGELPAKKRHILRAALSVNGKVSNDSMEKYLSARSYVSSSELKEVLKTPRHYLQYREPVVKRDAKHFELGTFAHSAFLEPKKFDKVRVEPAASLSTKDGIMSMIEWYCTELCRPLPDLRIMKMNELRDELAELREEFDKAGFVSVSAEQKTIIECIRIAYKTYAGGILPKLLKLADAETSFYTTDPASGINVRIRPDGLFLEENVGFNGILSLKTTSCQSIDAFARDCAKYVRLIGGHVSRRGEPCNGASVHGDDYGCTANRSTVSDIHVVVVARKSRKRQVQVSPRIGGVGGMPRERLLSGVRFVRRGGRTRTYQVRPAELCKIECKRTKRIEL